MSLHKEALRMQKGCVLLPACLHKCRCWCSKQVLVITCSPLSVSHTRSATARVNLDFRTARCTVCLSFHAAAAAAAVAAAGVLYFLCAQ
jgi:hypothetical protein